MERIKTAAELSRMQREVTRDTQPLAAESPPIRAVGGDENARRVTRVVPLDPVALERERVLRPGAVGEVGPAYKMLRTQVVQRLEQLGVNTLAVVSPRSAEGKTTTAINLSVALACDPTRTALLVDLDLRRPSVCRRMGVSVEAGVEDHLQTRLPLDRVLFRPERYERLVVLPARSPVANSSELLLGLRARDLAQELKTRYTNRVVLYDLPPVLEADDALAFIRNVDAALVVVREGRTRRDDVMRTIELLRDTPVVGTVLNGSREARERQYYVHS